MRRALNWDRVVFAAAVLLTLLSTSLVVHSACYRRCVELHADKNEGEKAHYDVLRCYKYPDAEWSMDSFLWTTKDSGITTPPDKFIPEVRLQRQRCTPTNCDDECPDDLPTKTVTSGICTNDGTKELYACNVFK
jgi:hypothetical protein